MLWITPKCGERNPSMLLRVALSAVEWARIKGTKSRKAQAFEVSSGSYCRRSPDAEPPFPRALLTQ